MKNDINALIAYVDSCIESDGFSEIVDPKIDREIVDKLKDIREVLKKEREINLVQESLDSLYYMASFYAPYKFKIKIEQNKEVLQRFIIERSK